MKHGWIGKNFRLPCPPYGSEMYWQGVYSQLGPEDSFEWGNLCYTQNLRKYSYQEYSYDSIRCSNPKSESSSMHETTLADTLGVSNKNSPHSEDEPILMLGCGNSKLGEELLQDQFRGPIIQVDFSQRIIESMALRYSAFQQKGDMQFVTDDATTLSKITPGSVHAAIDKGLLDALFCADEYDDCLAVMRAVQRVLIPGGVFCTFSFSKPEYLLDRLAPEIRRNRKTTWEDVEVRQLPSIFLYRFEKPKNSSVKLKRRALSKSR